MASYLGHIVNVAQLVNECNVYPDIADIQGNTALMYAAVSAFYYFNYMPKLCVISVVCSFKKCNSKLTYLL